MARKRKITSLMHVVAGPDMNDASGVCGEFAEDLAYAAAVTRDALALLVENRDRQQREDDELPFMLRVA